VTVEEKRQRPANELTVYDKIRELSEDIQNHSPEGNKAACDAIAASLILNVGRGMPVPEYTDYGPTPTDSCRRYRWPPGREAGYYFCNEEFRKDRYDMRDCCDWAADRVENGEQPAENLLYPADQRTVISE